MNADSPNALRFRLSVFTPADIKKSPAPVMKQRKVPVMKSWFPTASFTKWGWNDVVGVLKFHKIPCFFAVCLVFFMGVEYTLSMVPASSQPFDLGFIVTRQLNQALASRPDLNTILAALNTAFVLMQTTYIVWVFLVEGRARPGIAALFMFTCRGILGYSTQLPLPEGNPIDWVSTHRYHHQYCDSEQDPHSPLEGFWFSHMNWFFDIKTILKKCGEPSNVGDLEKQTFYRFMRSTYIWHPIALGLLLYVSGGFPYLVWGMGVRTIWVYHITWLVNSACHVWGTQAWNTGDLSTNNWWVALLAFGEGWHNNHHAFEYSARHGLEWWQIDMTWYTVKLLQVLGLATDVKLPQEAHKQRLAFQHTKTS